MKSKLRTSKKLNKDPTYLLKEKKIINMIFKILLIIVLIIVLINLIDYINILSNELFI